MICFVYFSSSFLLFKRRDEIETTYYLESQQIGLWMVPTIWSVYSYSVCITLKIYANLSAKDSIQLNGTLAFSRRVLTWRDHTENVFWPTGRRDHTQDVFCPTGRRDHTENVFCPTGRRDHTENVFCPTGRRGRTENVFCPTGRRGRTENVFCPTGRRDRTENVFCPAGRIGHNENLQSGVLFEMIPLILHGIFQLSVVSDD